MTDETDSVDATRRRLLATLGAGGLTGLAGCNDAGRSDGTPTATDTPTPTDAGGGGRAAVVLEPVTDVSATGALVGATVALGGAESGDLRFEYRSATATAWTTAAAVTVDADGTVERRVSGLEPRRSYEVRAVLVAGGERYTTRADAFAAVAPDAGGGAETPLATASEFAPGDGFAPAAPWLDDATPVMTVSEPTRRALADALQADGERLVVFETSGTIDLEGGVAVDADRCYVAGQTAPSPGVTLVGGSLFVDADDVVIQHVRVRRGDDTPDAGAGDAVGTAENVRNVVFDHVTASWGTDEVLSPYGTDVTVSNCIVAEGLRNSAFHRGGNGHSAGSLVGSGYERVALLGNVWASNLTRNPRLQSGTAAVVNNVSYDYRHAVGCSSLTTASVVGNTFRRGNVGEAVITEMDAHEGALYVAGNRTLPEQRIAEGGLNQVSQPPVWPDGLEALPAADGFAHAVAHAGARPADRTYHDRRVLSSVVNWAPTGDHRPGGSGLDHAWLDHEELVGGYPDLPEVSRPLDVPASGTRAWLNEFTMAVETPAPGPGAYREAAGPGTVDDFADGDRSAYVGALVDAAGPTVAPVAEHYAVTADPPVATGEYSLKNTSGEVALVSAHADLPRFPRAGDTLAAAVATTEVTPVLGVAFGVSTQENYYFVRHTPARETLAFHRVTETEGSDPASERLAESDPVAVEQGTVYDLVVDWGVDGAIDVALRDPAGETVASVSVSDSTHRFGGVGTRRSGMLDDLRVR